MNQKKTITALLPLLLLIPTITALNLNDNLSLYLNCDTEEFDGTFLDDQTAQHFPQATGNFSINPNGKIKQSCHFNNLSVLTIPDVNGFLVGNGTQPNYTISFWANNITIPDTNPTNKYVFWKEGGGIGDPPIAHIEIAGGIAGNSQDLDIIAEVAAPTPAPNTQIAITDNHANHTTYRHYVFTHTQTGGVIVNNISFYLDGIFQNSTTDGTAPTIDPGSPLFIGEETNTLSQLGLHQWLGDIDEIAIWYRALEPEEISQIYNNGDGTSFNDINGVTANTTLGFCQEFGEDCIFEEKFSFSYPIQNNGWILFPTPTNPIKPSNFELDIESIELNQDAFTIRNFMPYEVNYPITTFGFDFSLANNTGSLQLEILDLNTPELKNELLSQISFGTPNNGAGAFFNNKGNIGFKTICTNCVENQTTHRAEIQVFLISPGISIDGNASNIINSQSIRVKIDDQTYATNIPFVTNRTSYDKIGFVFATADNYTLDNIRVCRGLNTTTCKSENIGLLFTTNQSVKCSAGYCENSTGGVIYDCAAHPECCGGDPTAIAATDSLCVLGVQGKGILENIRDLIFDNLILAIVFFGLLIFIIPIVIAWKRASIPLR